MRQQIAAAEAKRDVSTHAREHEDEGAANAEKARLQSKVTRLQAKLLKQEEEAAEKVKDSEVKKEREDKILAVATENAKNEEKEKAAAVKLKDRQEIAHLEQQLKDKEIALLKDKVRTLEKKDKTKRGSAVAGRSKTTGTPLMIIGGSDVPMSTPDQDEGKEISHYEAFVRKEKAVTAEAEAKAAAAVAASEEKAKEEQQTLRQAKEQAKRAEQAAANYKREAREERKALHRTEKRAKANMAVADAVGSSEEVQNGGVGGASRQDSHTKTTQSRIAKQAQEDAEKKEIEKLKAELARKQHTMKSLAGSQAAAEASQSAARDQQEQEEQAAVASAEAAASAQQSLPSQQPEGSEQAQVHEVHEVTEASGRAVRKHSRAKKVIKQGDPSMSDLDDLLNPKKSARMEAEIDQEDPSAPHLADDGSVGTASQSASDSLTDILSGVCLCVYHFVCGQACAGMSCVWLNVESACKRTYVDGGIRRSE